MDPAPGEARATVVTEPRSGSASRAGLARWPDLPSSFLRCRKGFVAWASAQGCIDGPRPRAEARATVAAEPRSSSASRAGLAPTGLGWPDLSASFLRCRKGFVAWASAQGCIDGLRPRAEARATVAAEPRSGSTSRAGLAPTGLGWPDLPASFLRCRKPGLQPRDAPMDACPGLKPGLRWLPNLGAAALREQGSLLQGSYGLISRRRFCGIAKAP